MIGANLTPAIIFIIPADGSNLPAFALVVEALRFRYEHGRRQQFTK
jgi:hypothetical protein